MVDGATAAHAHIGGAAAAQMPDELEGRPIAGAVRIVFALAALASTLLVLNQLLNLQLFAGVVFIDNRYLYLLAATLFPLIFLIFPAGARRRAPE